MLKCGKEPSIHIGEIRQLINHNTNRLRISILLAPPRLVGDGI
jgi:hypothetical protein